MTLRQNAAPASGSRKSRRMAAKLAKKDARTAASARPSDIEARAPLTRALHLRMDGRLDEAEAVYRELLVSHPNLMPVQFGIATLLDKRKEHKEAYEHYKIALTLAPHDFDCWYRFSECLRELAEYEAAEVAIKRALKIRPNDPGSYVTLARVLEGLDEAEKALSAVNKALELDSSNPLHHFEQGRYLMALGDFTAARKSYEKTVELDPNYTEILYFQICQMRGEFDDVDEVLRTLERTSRSSNTPSSHRAYVNFTIGRIKESQKDYDAAFEHYAKANATWHEKGEFNPEQTRMVVDALIAAYTPEVFEIHKSSGSSSTVPVFIVGMPRSGTTLTESIVSSHPRAGTTGELKKMGQLAQTLWRARDGELAYPRDIARILPERLMPFADQYLSRLMRDCPPDTLKMIDKLPMNFFQLGLISVLFRNATIIHCKRDPIDTCLSCFLQNFEDAIDFSNDLRSLGFYYRQYERLMAHWKSVVPLSIIDVQYEDMVANQEDMSRKIIDFVGLDWDDACLNFHEKESTVRTASQWQVRQPVYKSSVERWRRYEKYLDPLHESLAEHDFRS